MENRFAGYVARLLRAPGPVNTFSRSQEVRPIPRATERFEEVDSKARIVMESVC